MAPLRFLATIALGAALCTVFPATVLAQQDGDNAAAEPVFLSGVGAPTDDEIAILSAPTDGSNTTEPVFLSGVGAPTEDGETAAKPAILTADGSSNAEPVFLSGVGAPTDGSSNTNNSGELMLGAGSGPGDDTAPIILGGWPSMAVGDNEISFLVSAIGDQSKYDPSLTMSVCMKDVVRLEYQVVAGTNFRYTGHGCVLQSGSPAIGGCAGECAVEELQVTIFTQEWTNTLIVSDIKRLHVVQ